MTPLLAVDLSPQQRRILIRAWRRGLRELDVLLGTFINVHLPHLSLKEMDDFEQIMDLPDQEVLNALMGLAPISPGLDCPVFHALIDFHKNSHTQ